MFNNVIRQTYIVLAILSSIPPNHSYFHLSLFALHVGNLTRSLSNSLIPTAAV